MFIMLLYVHNLHFKGPFQGHKINQTLLLFLSYVYGTTSTLHIDTLTTYILNFKKVNTFKLLNILYIHITSLTSNTTKEGE